VGEATEAEAGGLSMPGDSTAGPPLGGPQDCPRDGRPSDEELACRAQRGCSASFEELVRRFQVPLLQFLLHFAAREDAEDLVQDTLLRAYQNLHRYRPSWRFATWLFTIARRLRVNYLRRKRPKADCELLETAEDREPPPGQRMAQEESRQRLWDLAAEVLTEPQMTATWLYYVEDVSVRQIARVLGRSQMAAKATLFRARKKLSAILQKLESASPDSGRDRSMNTIPCPAAVETNDG
jgi:RNA polymerase sigma-70 factor (ECF subfamily)